MKINKEFIKILAKKKHGWVGDIIKDMNFLIIKDGIIQNLDKKYKVLEEIYYTVDSLEKEEFISVDTTNYGSGIPSFNPIEFWGVDNKDDPYVNDRMTFIDEMNKSYWGKDISINSSFYSFIENKFKTDKQIQDLRNMWIPIMIAILSAFLTAVFSMIFNNQNISFLIFK